MEEYCHRILEAGGALTSCWRHWTCAVSVATNKENMGTYHDSQTCWIYIEKLPLSFRGGGSMVMCQR